MLNKGLGYQMNSPSGSTRVYTGHNKFLQDLMHRLSTPLGSVVGNPTYGSRIHKYKYYPCNSATAELIATAVYDILNIYKGVEVQEVTYSYDDNARISVGFKITYNGEFLEDSLTFNMQE